MRLASASLIPVLVVAAGCTSSSPPPKDAAGSDALRDASGQVDQATDPAADPAGDQLIEMPGAMDVPAVETPRSCDEVTGSGCAAPMKCSLNCMTRSIECLAGGAKVLGDACTMENECSAGLGCSCTAPMMCKCRKYCKVDGDCAAGKMCNVNLSCTGDPTGTERARICAE